MALAAAMLTPACGNNAGKETKAEVQESAAVQANVTHLTKADFLAKVYNYEKNPKEWKYVGVRRRQTLYRGFLCHLVWSM